MMLDSAVGKILTSKRAEPSIPNNTETKSTNESLSLQPSKSEAEVRLVVRLLVEEHIVYNGKIEKVKRLESEELSRIVSRIAWDGAKNESLEERSVERCLTINEKSDDLLDDGAQVSERPTTTSGHTDACPQEEQNSEGLKSQDINCKLPSKENEDYQHNFSTREEFEEDSKFIDCDIDRVQPNSGIQCCVVDETSQDCFESQSKISDQASCKNNDDTVAYYTDSLCKSSFCELDESQSIADTLNDCVNSVDLESRQFQQAQLHSVNNGIQVGILDTLQVADNCHNHKQIRFDNGTQNQVIDTSPKTKYKIGNSNDTDPKSNLNQIKPINEIGEQLDPSLDESDLQSDSIPERKPGSCHSARRKGGGVKGAPTKRARRSIVKDNRRSSNPHCTRISENSPTTRQGAELLYSSTNNATSSYLVRHSKIFAKWSDNHFYPGTILRSLSDRKFVIGFYDGAQRNVSETDLIALSNIEGRQVRVSIAKNYCVNALVHHQRSPINDQPMFDVEYQQDGLVKRSVPLKDIFLTGEQGAPLINQPVRPDKNPDESMFAGVDLDNIVHVKRSRRLLEMEEYELPVNSSVNDNGPVSNRRKRAQYNTRNTLPRGRPMTASGRDKRLAFNDINNDIATSSCSPENLKSNLNFPHSNAPSECSNSTGSSNTSNVDMGNQEFYFDNSSPHRTKTSLLL